MKWEDGTPITRPAATALLADIIRPQSILDAEHADTARLTAREKAQLRGWNIDPELTPGAPHDFKSCGCAQRANGDRPCTCSCHGRTFYVYRRGA